MGRASESWERLVTSVLRDEDLRLTALRTPSDISSASSSTSSRLFAGNLQPFTHHQILRATDGFNASNLIKQGQSGDLFYGTSDDGTPIVVKKADITSAKKKSRFSSELEVAGKLSHPRLVSLLGHCSELRYRKFLVYNYISNKDLSSCLFGGSSLLLNWKTRLKIAIGVAEPLCYLHHQCVPPLVHRNIQTGSILLDANFDVRLGSLDDLCAEGKEVNQHAIYEPLWLRKLYQMLLVKGTVSNTKRAFDVYCFGKVLLELITSKLGFSAAYDSTFMDWEDHTLAFIVPDNHRLMLDITVPSLIIDNYDLIEVWGVALVAKACLSLNSSEQPQMSNVLLALLYIESAKFRYSSFDDASVNPVVITKVLEGLMILGISSGTTSGGTLTNQELLTIPSFSELVDAQWNFTTVIPRNMTSPESCLEEAVAVKVGDGSLVAIRKYYAGNTQRLIAWQAQADMLRRLSHPNLAKLVDYYFSKDKRLVLVQECPQNGSLKDQFNRAAAKLLSMETRLKILIGAARGLEFLHANERRGFYEYFETSDICLDNSYNARLLGFGLAKVLRPNPYDDMVYSASSVHEAPELREYAAREGYTKEEIVKGIFPIENDVYGFGVVMFDLLTGVLTEQRLDAFRFVEVWSSRIIKSEMIEIIKDNRLKGKHDARIARQLAALALKCSARDVEERPSMRQVVGELESINLLHKATI